MSLLTVCELFENLVNLHYPNLLEVIEFNKSRKEYNIITI